jgi:hypothetical protein
VQLGPAFSLQLLHNRSSDITKFTHSSQFSTFLCDFIGSGCHTTRLWKLGETAVVQKRNAVLPKLGNPGKWTKFTHSDMCVLPACFCMLSLRHSRTTKALCTMFDRGTENHTLQGKKTLRREAAAASTLSVPSPTADVRPGHPKQPRSYFTLRLLWAPTTSAMGTNAPACWS